MSSEMSEKLISGLKIPTAEDAFEWSPPLRALPVPGIRRMVNLAASMKDVIHLSIGQPDFPCPKHIVDAYIHALQEGETGYTMDAGLPELLKELSSYYCKRTGREITEDNILVTTGATEAMYLAISVTSAPGRQFLIPDPCFPLYAPLVRMHGGEVKPIPTRAEHGHQLDPQDVINAIGPRTFAIILNSPNNPTGAVYPQETIEAIVQEAAYQGIKVISDEVYDHLLLDDLDYASVLGHASDLDHVMIASSFSKSYSMAGLRIGWVISSQGTIKMLRRYHMFTTTVANTPSQWAGVAALRGGEECIADMVKEYRRRRDRIVQLVSESPHLTGYWPQGGFFIFPSLPPHTNASNVALRMLEDIGVCVVPGEAFGESCNNSLRISYSTSMEKIEEAFQRMIPWLAKQEL
ncbi:pyridoxal phosphate-dependent aminotransferase [Bremerella sp. T1]|uniref:pyridoxal phosphate-dependent aminotransferase n=1 Tax=Bremerella sp. TYQ1 TaxID=3119568 RepID=UPI001CCB323E|nr:pyridoxal phosphate-dependent aminotransferase [Bremerella volcania]UBM37151.1 pyridoxal phosphate-dependent aminotransferase [Bremerella volcania]